jgi:hypothetical protein
VHSRRIKMDLNLILKEGERLLECQKYMEAIELYSEAIAKHLSICVNEYTIIGLNEPSLSLQSLRK